MQIHVQKFPPNFVYLLHAAPPAPNQPSHDDTPATEGPLDKKSVDEGSHDPADPNFKDLVSPSPHKPK